MRVLHLTTHTNIGGITVYIKRLVRPLQQLGTETWVLSSGGEKTEAMHTEGAHVLELPIKTKNIFHPKLWLALPRLVTILKHNKIDLIHAHTRVTQVWGAVASRLTGIPLVTTCHGFYKPKLGRKLFPCWGKKVVAISSMVSEHLAKDFNLPQDRIRLIYNAVNIPELEAEIAGKDSAKIKKAYGFSPEDPVVGIIARMVNDKGHDSLIRAVPFLKKRFPNIRILLVGEGKFKPELERITAELKLENHVRFCGNVPDITEPLAAMDVFTLPATWREGFGLSLIEAMACRKPVVVTNVWSLNTLIQDRETGLIVEPKQAEALANGLAELIADKTLREKVGQAGYAMVWKEFSIDRMAAEMNGLYKEVVPGKS